MESVIEWMVDVSFRPPRHMYDEDETVSVVTTSDTVFIRKTVIFSNKKGWTLHGSVWYDRSFPMPTACMLYLHSLGTNQFECLNLVPFIVSPELALFSFDFPGCGISEGDYIPLDGSGIDDVLAAKEALDHEYQFSKYALWGRSMGAAIALHSASATDYFTCVVSDSAYENTESVVKDQAEQNGLPWFILNLIEPIIKRRASAILGTNIYSPYPIAEVPKSKTPLLMGHGKQDSFVTLSQAQNIFDSYGCFDKQLYIFDARHNTVRPYQWYETAARFICRKLDLQPNKRFYDAIFHEAELHSGNREQIIRDINQTIYNRGDKFSEQSPRSSHTSDAQTQPPAISETNT